jgi:NDP-sugar pyrophosphorylase family protein
MQPLPPKPQGFSRITVIKVNSIIPVNNAKKPRIPAATETNASFVSFVTIILAIVRSSFRAGITTTTLKPDSNPLLEVLCRCLRMMLRLKDVCGIFGGSMSLKAAVLAGGAGTRLYPLTAYVPKTLIPIGSRYVIEFVIDYLKQHGINEIVMLVSESECELVRNHLGDGSRFGVRVEYSVAERIGTAGALGTAADLLGERFVAYYGDVLTDMDLRAMTEFHTERKAVCTIAMSTAVPIEYGVARVQDDGRISYFEEKPVLKEYPISMGIHVLEKEVLSYCKPNTDLAHDVIPNLLRDRKAVYAYLTDKRHYDIGTFKSLEKVRTFLEEKRTLFNKK